MRAPTRPLVFALGVVACGTTDGYPSVEPDTAPAISRPYPDYYLKYEDPTLEPVTFGKGSVDLSVTIVPSGNAGVPRVLDLAYPDKTLLHGYGRYLGTTETYRRTRMIDGHGVHGVRVAVYRADAGRKHTNVWSHFLARAEDGEMFLTEQSQWDWIGGDEETTAFSDSAWPFYHSLTRSHYFYDSFFGFTPGVYSRSEFIRKVVLSTTAVSPTYGIPDCAQILFNANDPGLRHQVFISETLGLVEIVFRWHDLDGINAWDYPLVPQDGFAAPADQLQRMPVLQTTWNMLSGSWEGAMDDPPDSTALADGFRLQLDADGLNHRPLSGTYEFSGTYSDAELETAVYGRYDPDRGEFQILGSNSGDQDVTLWGYYFPDGGVGGRLVARVDRTTFVSGSAESHSGTATIDWVPP